MLNKKISIHADLNMVLLERVCNGALVTLIRVKVLGVVGDSTPSSVSMQGVISKLLDKRQQLSAFLEVRKYTSGCMLDAMVSFSGLTPLSAYMRELYILLK